MWIGDSTLPIYECVLIQNFVLNFLLYQSWKTITCCFLDLIIDKILFPKNTIHLMKPLSLIACRWNELIQIIHPPHLLCILKYHNLIWLLYDVLNVLEIIIEKKSWVLLYEFFIYKPGTKWIQSLTLFLFGFFVTLFNINPL